MNRTMSNKNVDSHILKLAKSLSENDKKNALGAIRGRMNEPFENGYLEMVWKGWERALNRDEMNALVYQLLKGTNIKEAKKTAQDMKKKKIEILIRDHTQSDLSKFYISSWVSLLEIYCNLKQDE